MRLEWSAFAIEDRDGILDYIEEDGPHAAVVVDDRIRAHVRQLLQFPETGRPGRMEGIRDWSSAEHRILHVSIVKERKSVGGFKSKCNKGLMFTALRLAC